ncbi:Slp family lipoprotein [uncultured Thiodictyon sp.]|jgi:outer membrane lipoprotein|uniref:Slp family lipoprotein n=1 Tax=uncultured Thiodictyon sp. TaxID=1846217 RepID=UPI0025F8C739|nr:Slp family lipoprotein [uncultured Thiodictyon sp.]
MKSRTAGIGLPLALLIALGLPGCATTDCVGAVGNPALTPAQVGATRGHTGELARWGGTLVEALNLADRTELTVIAYPLERCGAPRLGQEPIGRFIAVAPGYLETADYRPGRTVTATGLITGTREGQVGAAPYPLPLLAKARVRLWPTADAAGPGSGDGFGRVRPWIGIGIGGGSGGWYGGGGGGIGIQF